MAGSSWPNAAGTRRGRAFRRSWSQASRKRSGGRRSSATSPSSRSHFTSTNCLPRYATPSDELYGCALGGNLYGTLADERSPITAENLKQVLDRLNDVLAEAARLRKEVIRQLSEQRGRQQQHLSTRKRKVTRKK